MKTLAIDLSSARGSIAFLAKRTDPVVREWDNNRKHSGLFFENLQNVIRQFGAPELIVVGLGPGSYAGTRIAISAAIGLQQASPARLIGVPSICAFDIGESEYWVIGDARRQSFFSAHVRNNAYEKIELSTESDLRQRLESLPPEMAVVTSEKRPQFPRATLDYPSALVLANLAERGKYNEVTPLEPIYLREPHITIPKTPVQSNIK